MTIEQYQTLTGETVAAGDLARVTAQIARARKTLENLLGYTLVTGDVLDNQYTEIGKTTTTCPCPDGVDMDNLEPPDAVMYAYRLFSYNKKDQFLYIDPATAVNKVKLVKDGVTYKTIDPSDYRLVWKNGIVKYLDQQGCWCPCFNSCVCCENVQLAVDADWVDVGIEDDIMYIWADMITYYADPKTDIKSETLGPHSYTRFDADEAPETLDYNLAVLKKYVGPNGSLYKFQTV